ncbi:MAG: hypothetical protein EPN17_03090 [Methylobacter sp.]|nr:MAG: hypothetical protein EPN17_03090 [Methylobacter sp.]
MKFRHNAPAVLIITVVIAITIISVVSNRISSQMTASSEEGQFAMMSEIMKSKLVGAENNALSSAEMVAAMPDVKAAFAAKDRERLLAITQDIFRIQHDKYGFTQAQFHELPAVSFLRVHNPKKFGEDLSGYRQMVVDVNRNIAIRKGIEVTTSGVGIFGTLPMTDAAGVHTGSFEMALEFGPLLDALKAAYGFELAVFIEEKILHEVATSLKGDILNEQNRVGKYIKFYTTHSELLRALVSDADINISEDTHYVRDAVGVPYGVLLQPLYNYAHKQIGVVAISGNFGATRSAAGQALVWQSLLAIVVIIVLIGAILIVVRGLLLQPLLMLSERLAALAKGDCSQTIEDTDSLCEEMQQLADNYEQLRAQIQRSKSVGSEL